MGVAVSRKRLRCDRVAGRVRAAVMASCRLCQLRHNYGSLGAAISMIIWMRMSSIVILVGAGLNSEIEHQTAEDSTTGCEKPIGQRGAAMADT
jgi:hypothetical protein